MCKPDRVNDLDKVSYDMFQQNPPPIACIECQLRPSISVPIHPPPSPIYRYSRLRLHAATGFTSNTASRRCLTTTSWFFLPASLITSICFSASLFASCSAASLPLLCCKSMC